MKSGENTLRSSHSAFPIVRLPTLLVDLLLDGLSMLIRDNAPGVTITTFHYAQELQAEINSEVTGILENVESLAHCRALEETGVLRPKFTKLYQSYRRGAHLAEPDITRKLRVYHTMYRLNLSFGNIVV